MTKTAAANGKSYMDFQLEQKWMTLKSNSLSAGCYLSEIRVYCGKMCEARLGIG